MNRWLLLCFSVLLITVSPGCKKESQEESGPQTRPVQASTDTLVFTNDGSKTFTLTLVNKDTSEFRITSYPDWVQVYPLSGMLTHDPKTITVTATIMEKEPGTYTSMLNIFTNLNSVHVWVKGIVPVHSSFIVPDSILFTEFKDTVHFTITNKGNKATGFSTSSSGSTLTFINGSGSLAPGISQQVIVNVNRTSLQTGTFTEKFFISGDNQVLDTVVATIKNIKENKLILSSDVTDAEFSRTSNLLVYVSADANNLSVYYPETGNIETVALSYPPTCISISSDGTRAIVGHDAHLSYVNLVTKLVIRTYDISCSVFDVVLADNSWAYAMPTGYQWEKIRCVNLTDGSETLSTGYDVNAETKLKMHPSGNYIYGADNHISPTDIEKYDIRPGTLAYMYDSPYHGDYPIDGDLWLSEDGSRIFTKGKSVFKTSEIQEQDMLYNGTIYFEGSSSGYNTITWLDISSAAGNLYILFSGPYYSDPNMPYLYIHNSGNLVYKSRIELEKYVVPDGQGGGSLYDAEPFFAFTNASGNTVYVITKGTGSGLLHQWAIQKVQVRK